MSAELYRLSNNFQMSLLAFAFIVIFAHPRLVSPGFLTTEKTADNLTYVS